MLELVLELGLGLRLRLELQAGTTMVAGLQHAERRLELLIRVRPRLKVTARVRVRWLQAGTPTVAGLQQACSTRSGASSS